MRNIHKNAELLNTLIDYCLQLCGATENMTSGAKELKGFIASAKNALEKQEPVLLLEMKYCPRCGADRTEHYDFCPDCGQALAYDIESEGDAF